MFRTDILEYMTDFYDNGHILDICSSSFITLIPKNKKLVYVNDFHPISLIILQCKIIDKLLANNLINRVIDLIISLE